LKFDFTPLPSSGSDEARPALIAEIVGRTGTVPVFCLVDTGSLHNRFARWVADEAGIDLTGATVTRLAVGGITTEARTVSCQLQLGDAGWEAPVSFCDPWPVEFQVLGQLGFLRWFRITIDAADEALEVIPNRV